MLSLFKGVGSHQGGRATRIESHQVGSASRAVIHILTLSFGRCPGTGCPYLWSSDGFVPDRSDMTPLEHYHSCLLYYPARSRTAAQGRPSPFGSTIFRTTAQSSRVARPDAPEMRLYGLLWSRDNLIRSEQALETARVWIRGGEELVVSCTVARAS